MSVKKINNYFMILSDWAYDPFVKDGVRYIRVTNIHKTSYTSVYRYDDALLIASTMTADMIDQYFPAFKRNYTLLGEGFNA